MNVFHFFSGDVVAVEDVAVDVVILRGMCFGIDITVSFAHRGTFLEHTRTADGGVKHLGSIAGNRYPLAVLLVDVGLPLSRR